MARKVVLGASVAATLPAALAAAVLVSAPFAGTTTAPLSDQHKARHHHGQHRHLSDRGAAIATPASDKSSGRR